MYIIFRFSERLAAYFTFFTFYIIDNLLLLLLLLNGFVQMKISAEHCQRTPHYSNRLSVYFAIDFKRDGKNERYANATPGATND